jgi:hypothetical protein
MAWFVPNWPENDVPMQVTAAVEVCSVDAWAAAAPPDVLTTAAPVATIAVKTRFTISMVNFPLTG